MAITTETLSFIDAQTELGLSSFDEVAAAILADQIGSGVFDVSYTGAGSAAFAVADFGIPGQFALNGGFFLSSGGFPGFENTASGFSIVNGTAGDLDLDQVALTAFPGASLTNDASVLEFSVDIDDENITGISFDIVFGSDEFPEYSDTSFVDVAAVFINGENIALFDGDENLPLSVTSGSLDGHFVDNTANDYEIEWDGFSRVLTVRGALNQGVNSIKIGVADTGDYIYDSGIYVTNIDYVEGGIGEGILVVVDGSDGDDQIVATTVKEEINLLAGADSVEGAAADLDGDVITGFGADDKIIVKGMTFSSAALAFSATTGKLVVDADGDDDPEFALGLEGDFADAAFVATSVGADTEITLEDEDEEHEYNQIVGTEKRDKLFGTDGDDQIRSLGGHCDKMWGGLGDDQFVFGAETDNGKKEKDIIRDYEAGSDSILLEAGVELHKILEKGCGLALIIGEDEDKVLIRGKDLDADDLTIYSDDVLLVA